MSQSLAGQNIFLYISNRLEQDQNTLQCQNLFSFSFILPLSPSACKSANIDLVFLIDGSKSVRPQNFELVKKFVNQVGHDVINWFSYNNMSELIKHNGNILLVYLCKVNHPHLLLCSRLWTLWMCLLTVPESVWSSTPAGSGQSSL